MKQNELINALRQHLCDPHNDLLHNPRKAIMPVAPNNGFHDLPSGLLLAHDKRLRMVQRPNSICIDKAGMHCDNVDGLIVKLDAEGLDEGGDGGLGGAVDGATGDAAVGCERGDDGDFGSTCRAGGGGAARLAGGEHAGQGETQHAGKAEEICGEDGVDIVDVEV